MKPDILSKLGLFLLLIGSASPLLAEPQRGSRGSSGSSASPSRGSSGGSYSRPSSSQGSRGSSPAPRPSGGSFSRPSPSTSPGPSRGTSPGVRPSTIPSARPSAPPSVRPSGSSGGTAVPGSGFGRPVPPSVTSPRPTYGAGTPTPSSTSGRDLYSGRTLPSAGPTTSPSDSAPTAGPAVEPPGAGAPADGSPGSSVRSQPRIRFPAPYSPAGSTYRGSPSSRGTTLAPPSAGASSSPRSAGPIQPGGKGSPTLLDSGPRFHYDAGPTNRYAPSRPVAPAPKTSTPTTHPKTSTGPKAGSGRIDPTSPSAKQPGKTGKVGNWRDLKRNDPKAAREIFVATKAAGRGLDVGVGVVTGTLGGVSGSPYRGGGSGSGWSHGGGTYVHDPWGWNCWNSCSVSWGWCGWSSGWWFPWYWTWYYPCWWWYSQPYYYSDYCFYRPATTVVYTEPQVVYVQQPVSEAVGETVVAAPPAESAPAAQAPAPQAAQSPLSIAAQRYLELGDRAFRDGRYTDAVQFYAKSVEFAPDQGALYLVLSDALFASGDYHYGAYAVRRALELDPTLVQSQIDKHDFYPDPKQFDAQLAALEGYLAGHTGDRDARLLLALNYLFCGRAPEAVKVIESAAPSMSEDPAANQILERAHKLAGG